MRRLSPIQFFRRIKRLATAMRPNIGVNHFMHDEKKRHRQHRDYDPYCPMTIHYRNRWLAVEILCDPMGDKKGKLFCRVLPRTTANSTNTQHVTLTNENITLEGVYYVTPRLDKCRGRLRRVPRKIGAYPISDSTVSRRFYVGPLDEHLLARVFEIAIAKYDSIST